MAEGKRQKAEDKGKILRCIELARKGAGYVSSNPLVGCVITKNGKVIGEGYHEIYGKSHAEVNAINNAERKVSSLKGTTLYVNLEPCSHYGKTPPCVDAIIENKISRVVIGCRDPNPLVAGRGIKKLREHSITVSTGVLEKESIELNKFFFKHILTGIPYVTLKAAQTLDGKIADKSYKSKWISSESSRKIVHKLRSEYDAVLIGRNTLEKDNPKLTVRSVKGRNPYRIVLDTYLKSKLDYYLFTDKDRTKTIVVTSIDSNKKKAEDLVKCGVGIIFCKAKKGKLDLTEMLGKLGAMGINSILVEGGSEVFSEFIKQNLADELLLFISDKVMGEGISTFRNSKINFKNVTSRSFELVNGDVLMKIKF